MPLLGRKIFSNLKPLNDVKPEETVFTIPHTEEQFRSKAEYEKRVGLYSERVWTCQCTGHINLTHEEAWNSEKAVQKTLKHQFSKYFEKPVLLLVHHSTVSLDTLVDQAWLKLQQVLSIGEYVTLKVKTAGKVIKGRIIQVDTSGVEANPTSNCTSPSSDKENSSSESKDGSPKKWVPPKLLPYKYSIRLIEEDKIINAVPASDLIRCERPPSKELVRLFIRANAVRTGQTSTSPWVVNDKLVEKFSIPRKFADFMLSPVKMAEAGRRAETEGPRKRKLNKQHSSLEAKKQKVAKSSGSKHTKDGQKKKRSLSPKKKLQKPKEKSPKKVKRKRSADVIEINSDSSDDEVLANLKSSASPDSSDSDTPLVKIKSGLISKRKNDSSSDSDVPLYKLTPKKKKSLGSESPKKSKLALKKLKEKKTDKSHKKLSKKSPTKSPKKAPGSADGTPKKRGRPRKEDSASPSKSVKRNPKKTLKQMTLLDMSGKKGMKTPEKTTKVVTVQSPRTPAIVKKLMNLRKSDEKVKFGLLVKKAAMILNAQQRANLPEEIRRHIQKKYEQIEEKRLLDKMSPAEKEAYLKMKKDKIKQQRLEQQKAKLKELRKRFEDQDLKLTPLPQPKLLPTPNGLPNGAFGDVAMVTEFVCCYGGLLMPENEYPIHTDGLMKALVHGSQGFMYISSVLVILLQTLLQDQIAEAYSELKVSLSDIPVNAYTASELVRLCMRRNDAGEDADSDISDDDDDIDVPDELIHFLEKKEFYRLSPLQKLEVLKGLCLRILGSYSVQDYMEQKQQEAFKLTKQKAADRKEMNENLKEEKQKKKQNKEDDVKTEEKDCGKSGDSQDTPSPALTLTSFYGRGETDSSATCDSADGDIEGDNLASIVKRRRLMAAKAAVEKVQREKEMKIRREKEYQELRKRREKESLDKAYREGVSIAKMVLRHTPIGTDRNHSRYWIFNHSSPGLYIEKGWVNSDIGYNTQGVRDGGSAPTTPKKSESVSSDSQPNTPAKKGKRKKMDMESSFPQPGENLWFVYDSVKDLEKLMASLHPQGIRESSLKVELKKIYDDIIKAIHVAQKTNSELHDCDGDEEMLAGFKKELTETELRLRNGGLGGIPDYAAWESKVLSASDIATLGSCLKEVQDNIMEKFLKGFMKPKQSKHMCMTEINTDTNVKEEKDDDESAEVEEKEQPELLQWQEAVDNCMTLSRLHVLMGMLDSCIKWEKSAENAKCKICRKKGDDDSLLLCDECNMAFHMYCLRPAVVELPPGDWFCPACKPQTLRRRCRDVPRHYTEEGDSDEENDEEEIEHEENCAVCGGDEGLVFCVECPSAYHLECHDPPLRHPPRGRWVCTECKSGGRRKTRNKARGKMQRRKPAKRKVVYSSSEDEDEEEEEESDEEEDEETEDVTPRRLGTSRTTSRKETPTNSRSRSRASRGERKENVHENTFSRPTQNKRPPSELSICEEILLKLIKHRSSWPFTEAVDKREVPDYHEIIKHPMDFHTMKNKLTRLSYSSPEEFIKDASLVFRNASQYNKDDSEVYKCMLEVEKVFVDLLSQQLPLCHYSRDYVANGYSDHGYSSHKRPRRL